MNKLAVINKCTGYLEYVINYNGDFCYHRYVKFDSTALQAHDTYAKINVNTLHDIITSSYPYVSYG